MWNFISSTVQQNNNEKQSSHLYGTHKACVSSRNWYSEIAKNFSEDRITWNGSTNRTVSSVFSTPSHWLFLIDTEFTWNIYFNPQKIQHPFPANIHMEVIRRQTFCRNTEIGILVLVKELKNSFSSFYIHLNWKFAKYVQF